MRIGHEGTDGSVADQTSKQVWDEIDAQLIDLVDWERTLPDKITGLAGVQSPAASLASTAPVGPTSPVERANERIFDELDLLERLRNLARAWGWDERGTVTVYLRSRLSWAKSHASVEDAAETIGGVHARAARVVPSRLNRICPAHPKTQTLLSESESGTLYCSRCGMSASVEEVDAAGLAKLIGANPRVTVLEAAELLGIEPKRIRQWGVRARIDLYDGMVYLGEVYDQLMDATRPARQS